MLSLLWCPIRLNYYYYYVMWSNLSLAKAICTTIHLFTHAHRIQHSRRRDGLLLCFFFVFLCLGVVFIPGLETFLKIRISRKKLFTLDRCNIEDHSFKKATLFGPTSFSYHHYSSLGVLCICSTFLDLSPCSDPLYINSPTTIVGTMLAESKKPYSSLKVGLSFLLRCCAASLLEFTN